MISKETVFVLGAGASADYKFPTGKELGATIVRLCEDGVNHIREVLPDYGDITTFKRAFAAIRHSASIDAFIAMHPQFEKLGKALIALALIPWEDPGRTEAPECWFAELFRHMSSSTRSCDDFAANTVKFITFNYDRLIEQKLLHFVENFYQVEPARAAEVVRRIGIIHMYGQLGDHPYMHRNALLERPYSRSLERVYVARAMNGIRLIGQRVESDDLQNQAREWLRSAYQILFLGFGFDPLNVKTLALDHPSKAQVIRATMLKHTTQEIANRQVAVQRCLRIEYPVVGFDGTCLSSLRQWDTLAEW